MQHLKICESIKASLDSGYEEYPEYNVEYEETGPSSADGFPDPELDGESLNLEEHTSDPKTLNLHVEEVRPDDQDDLVLHHSDQPSPASDEFEAEFTDYTEPKPYPDPEDINPEPEPSSEPEPEPEPEHDHSANIEYETYVDEEEYFHSGPPDLQTPGEEENGSETHLQESLLTGFSKQGVDWGEDKEGILSTDLYEVVTSPPGTGAESQEVEDYEAEANTEHFFDSQPNHQVSMGRGGSLWRMSNFSERGREGANHEFVPKFGSAP